MRTLLFLLLVACETEKDGVQDTVGEDTASALDADRDGYPADEDCDDSDASVNPEAQEVCDGLDNDCDGLTDDEDDSLDGASTWFSDADQDGYGGEVVTACEEPEGSTLVSGDCDDASADVNPDATEACDGLDNDCDGQTDEETADTRTWYEDADGDGYGVESETTESCAQPDGYVDNAEDCDDRADDVNPGVSELCNYVDDDCDGQTDEDDAVDASTWYEDTDGDGYGDAGAPVTSCEEPDGYEDDADDCDDASASVSPDADELCNGIDDDCDGEADEGDALDASTWYTDADGDGYGEAGTGADACEQPEGTADNEQDCDDSDASLNPDTTWYIDYDDDGWGSESYTVTTCEQPDGYLSSSGDCDDRDEEVNPEAVETCNEIDDDCDDLVDDADDPVYDTETWYADTDGDGFGDAANAVDACEAPDGYGDDATDCDDGDDAVSPDGDEAWYDAVDSDCDGERDPSVCDELPEASTVEADPSCEGSWGTSWSVSTEWTTDTSTFYGAGNSYNQLMMTPVVGNLTDDNDDGVIDDQDIPDIVFTTFKDNDYNDKGYLRIVSGDGSTVHANVYSLSTGSSTVYVSGDGGVALGDLEGDGSPDIVTMTSAGGVLALEADGTLKWHYALGGSQTAYPAIADMDGDGQAEVIIGPTVLDSTGARVGLCAYGTSGNIAFAADIDLDGESELIQGNAVCDMDGGLVWASSVDAGWPGIGNFDDDDYPEVINVYRTDGEVTLLDDDGTVLWTATLTGGGGGPPVTGDFDGDGEQEIGVAGKTRFTVLETDGTTKWRTTIDDSSSYSAGASAFDFDADGALEIVYADENALYVFDGASGSTLWSTTSHQSGTIREYPIVADVDRDGHAEIVVASADYAASGWAGVHVLGETNGAWPSARLVMNQYAYDIAAIEDDLSVPPAGSSWLDWERFRGQRPWSDSAAGAANLSPAILGACEDCGSAEEVDFYVVVDNTGAMFAPEGVEVALYGVSGSTRTLLDATTTELPVAPGDRTEPIRFTLSLDELSSASDGVVVVVDEDGAIQECDETDNEASWDEGECF